MWDILTTSHISLNQYPKNPRTQEQSYIPRKSKPQKVRYPIQDASRPSPIPRVSRKEKKKRYNHGKLNNYKGKKISPKERDKINVPEACPLSRDLIVISPSQHPENPFVVHTPRRRPTVPVYPYLISVSDHLTIQSNRQPHPNNKTKEK